MPFESLSVMIYFDRENKIEWVDLVFALSDDDDDDDDGGGGGRCN